MSDAMADLVAAATPQTSDGRWQTLSRSRRKRVRDFEIDVWCTGVGWRWSVLDLTTGHYVGGEWASTQQGAESAALAMVQS